MTQDWAYVTVHILLPGKFIFYGIGFQIVLSTCHNVPQENSDGGEQHFLPLGK